jgi:phosphoenolpyruvate carboxykinase (ATP)
MQIQRTLQSHYGLEEQNIHNVNSVYWNLPAPFLYEQAIRRREARLAADGPLMVRTGHFTGRAPRDKFFVRESSSAEKIYWGDINRPIEPEHFDNLHKRMLAFMGGKDIFVKDCFAGADPEFRMPIRVITTLAWQSLFAHNLFIQATPDELAHHVPEFTVIAIPDFHAIPEEDGTRTEVFIIINFSEKLVLIGGTAYAGEIKKSIFSIMNYLLPLRNVLSMHCSANIGPKGDSALFFGLSGTGKTTLSTDPNRVLIGDDEHAWSDNGIFNLEGGCYAKVIHLSRKDEPEIYTASMRFGSLLENVTMDSATGTLDLDDQTLTENTRAAYPLSYIPNASPTGMGPHPSTLIMLTADAFGVMPPIAKLTPTQAMYHFLSGYTAKVAGTERGVTEPQATFSCCFGAPFMALSPSVYASQLGEKIEKHHANVWMINTGWSGGPYGVGKRVKIAYTRAMVSAALNGDLENVPMEMDPYLGLLVPRLCPGVPSEVLDPRSTWSDPLAYDDQVLKLSGMFFQNEQKFDGVMPAEVKEARPHARA